MFLYHLGLGVLVGYATVVSALTLQWGRNASRRRLKRRKVKAQMMSEARLWRDVETVLEAVKF